VLLTNATLFHWKDVSLVIVCVSLGEQVRKEKTIKFRKANCIVFLLCFHKNVICVESKGYPFLDEPEFFGVIACAAISRPSLKRNGELSDEVERCLLLLCFFDLSCFLDSYFVFV
jgi:hypothetical protein